MVLETLEAYELQGNQNSPYDLNDSSEYPTGSVTFTDIAITTRLHHAASPWGTADSQRLKSTGSTSPLPKPISWIGEPKGINKLTSVNLQSTVAAEFLSNCFAFNKSTYSNLRWPCSSHSGKTCHTIGQPLQSSVSENPNPHLTCLGVHPPAIRHAVLPGPDYPELDKLY